MRGTLLKIANCFTANIGDTIASVSSVPNPIFHLFESSLLSPEELLGLEHKVFDIDKVKAGDESASDIQHCC